MGFLLLVPFFLVRFTLMFRLDKSAISRAAHFPPLQGVEKAAYWVYQLSTTVLIFGIFALSIRTEPVPLFGAGLLLYLAGLVLLARAVVDFAAPGQDGMNRRGLYRYSRNPMYLAYFVFFLGCVILLQSLPLAGVLAAFQLSSHWIILAEERWCVQQFGEEYLRYQQEVRRYL